MSERTRVRKRSQQCGANEQVSGASKQESGPVLMSGFLVILDHSGVRREHRESEVGERYPVG